MENNETPEKRSILERLWSPNSQKDENLIRIFFWVSIIICVLLPRIFEGMLENRFWQITTITWIVLAIYIRFRIYTRR